jgi:hypothetical protein
MQGSIKKLVFTLFGGTIFLKCTTDARLYKEKPLVLNKAKAVAA